MLSNTRGFHYTYLTCSDILFQGEEVSTTSSTSKESSKSKHKKKSNYKHVPHCEKPPQVVAKRNARERRRVHAVNQAFMRLRRAIPFENKVKYL